MNPFDYVNSVLNKKQYIEDLSGYNPFLTNRALSYYPDTIFYAQELNMIGYLDNQMQYDLLYHAVPRANRIPRKWPKKNLSEQINSICQYYNCSPKKALEITKILNEDQIDQLISKVNEGKDN